MEQYEVARARTNVRVIKDEGKDKGNDDGKGKDEGN